MISDGPGLVSGLRSAAWAAPNEEVGQVQLHFNASLT